MTELQAAVGLAQIEKMHLILRENKKRYQILEKINSYAKSRKINDFTTPNFDTFIFIIKIQKLKKDIKLS